MERRQVVYFLEQLPHSFFRLEPHVLHHLHGSPVLTRRRAAAVSWACRLAVLYARGGCHTVSAIPLVWSLKIPPSDFRNVIFRFESESKSLLASFYL